MYVTDVCVGSSHVAQILISLQSKARHQTEQKTTDDGPGVGALTHSTAECDASPYHNTTTRTSVGDRPPSDETTQGMALLHVFHASHYPKGLR